MKGSNALLQRFEQGQSIPSVPRKREIFRIPGTERDVATLTRLRSVSNVDTIGRELATLARGDARHERTDQSNEHHDAFLAIQALRKALATAPAFPSTAAPTDDQTLWQDAISKASTAASADVQTRWDDAIAKAQIWLSSFN